MFGSKKYSILSYFQKNGAFENDAGGKANNAGNVGESELEAAPASFVPIVAAPTLPHGHSSTRTLADPPAPKRRRQIVDSSDEDEANGENDSGEEYVPSDAGDESDSSMESADGKAASRQRGRSKAASPPVREQQRAATALDSLVHGSPPVASAPQAQPNPKPTSSIDSKLKAFTAGAPPVAEASAQGSLSSTAAARRTGLVDLDEKRRDKKRAFEARNQDRYKWLEDVRDAKGRRPSDENYDPRTLHVPPEAFDRMSSFEKQFWTIKMKNWDVVLFFKKGKFYELYEKDADVGVRELNLKLTDRVNMRMVGVPERSLEQWASKLVARGYKVGRVEQMVTMAKKEDKKDVCRRELCQVLTRGTLVDMDMVTDFRAAYLFAIKEVDDNPHTPRFGICAVDAATGNFHIGEFADDAHRTRLETLLVQYRPVEILVERRASSAATRRTLRACCGSALVSALDPDTEFPAPDETVATRVAQLETFAAAASGKGVPAELHACIAGAPLAASAVAATVGYLQDLRMAKSIVSGAVWNTLEDAPRATLVMDGAALQQLEILENAEGRREGTLLDVCDRCRSNGGRRLLRQWLAHPLRRAADVSDRAAAVEWLMGEHPVDAACDEARALAVEAVRGDLRTLPDLERLIARMHAYAAGESEGAVMYDSPEAKKIGELLRLCDGLDIAATAVRRLAEAHQGALRATIPSVRLRALVTPEVDGGMWPDMEPLARIRAALAVGDGDNAHASASASTAPSVRSSSSAATAASAESASVANGFDDATDRARQREATIQHALDAELERWREYFGSSTVQFRHIQRETHQIEVPVAALRRKPAPDELELLSQTSSVRRFASPVTKKLVAELEDARDALQQASGGALRRLLAAFAQESPRWRTAAAVAAELDALLSLAEASSDMAALGPTCRAVVRDAGGAEGAELEARALRHPVVAARLGAAFIPNDIAVGTPDAPRCYVLTGPNMGGKSTLLRQVALAVVLAQVGCRVPAESAALAPFDRIFTRLGAHDRIMRGQSTFMVELEEAAATLREATPSSLCILDELGRGTATFDGHAIAHAVLAHLVARNVRVLFATHYTSLTDDFAGMPGVALAHMACHVPQSKDSVSPQRDTASDDARSNAADVTFLYRLREGVCAKAYGLRVARLAGLPLHVVAAAQRAADEHEAAGEANAFAQLARAVGALPGCARGDSTSPA